MVAVYDGGLAGHRAVWALAHAERAGIPQGDHVIPEHRVLDVPVSQSHVLAEWTRCPTRKADDVVEHGNVGDRAAGWPEAQIANEQAATTAGEFHLIVQTGDGVHRSPWMGQNIHAGADIRENIAPDEHRANVLPGYWLERHRGAAIVDPAVLHAHGGCRVRVGKPGSQSRHGATAKHGIGQWELSTSAHIHNRQAV